MIGQFVSDLTFKHQQYAVLIRSPVPAGRLAGVRLPDMPDGYAFYGAANVPVQKTIDIFDYPLPVFAEEEIAYQEQAIGILVGDTVPTLEALRKDVQVEIEPIPEESFEDGRTHTLFDYPIIAKEIRTNGDIDTVFETAQTITYSSLKIHSQYSARSEPFFATAVFREDGLDIYVPTQWPFHVRTAVAKAVGLAEEEVVVHPTATGESCNELLWYPSLLACQCAVAAIRQKRTVSLLLSAEESRAAAPKTPEMIIEHKSVLSDQKSITAMQISIIINSGACCPLIDKILKQMTAAALGPYRIPSYRIEARAARTPRGLIDIFEGWGDYFTSNALENHIAKIIQEYNLAPTEWRLAHISDNDAFSNLFEALMQKSNFFRKYAAYHVFNQAKSGKHDGRWRGIGLAAGFQYSGCAADLTYTVEMALNVRNQLSIKAEPAADDLKKIIRSLAAKGLEIPETDITFAGLTTADMNPSGPATAGNTVSIILPLVEQCITDLQDQRFRNPLPLGITRSYRIPQYTGPLAEKDGCVAFVSQTPAACIVELELLPVCYEVIIRNIWFACSPGKINEKKQIISYLHKNITAALSRTCKTVPHPSGAIDSQLPYSEYRSILPNEIPPVSVDIMERESSMSAFDSCAANVLPAAYLAALNQILLSVPARIDTLPVFTEDIFKALTGSK